MNIREFKLRFLNELFSRDVYTKKVNEVQYRTRCPYCGDSSKNLNTGHFYIRCDVNDNIAILYNCFRCPAHGRIGRDELEKLGIKNIDLQASIGGMNYKMIIPSTAQIIGDKFRTFSYTLPQNQKYREKLTYIEDRLKITVTDEIEKRIKVITSLKDFIDYNQINWLGCPPEMANFYEKCCIGFLSYGASHILFRDITGRSKISWYKYPITHISNENHVCYSISSEIDLFTDDQISVNLSEGVMDAIGVAYNCDQLKKNSIVMANGGKHYQTLINHIISLGFVGYNVDLNIYADNDEVFGDSRNNFDTTIPYFRKAFKDYKTLFNSVNIIYNEKSKDCGVPRSEIFLKSTKI